MKVAAPVAKRGKELLLFPHFGRAPYFAFAEVEEGKVISVEVVENSYKEHEHGRGSGVLGLILSRKPECLVALGMGERAFEQLAEEGVKVYFYPSKEGEMPPLEQAIEAVVSGKLKEATEAVEAEEEHRGHHNRNEE
jgi:predicted Fe-Mo cluster-binding NifX family protein